MAYSAHVDTFTRDNLPPPAAQPEFLFELPELKFPERMNCATELLDRHVAEGRGGRVCIQAPNLRWTYADLQEKANRIANVLVNELGIVPGNRVLLRAPNNPMMAACWFAVMKVGAVATATMPLLRAKELKHVIAKAKGEPRPVRPAPGGRTQAGRRRVARAEAHPLVQRCLCRWPRSGDGEAVRRIQQCRYRARRHLHPRLHLGHHRPAQGDHALPPRRHGLLRLLAAPCAARHARRHLHGHAAAGLHLRPRRPACCSRCRSAPRPCCWSRARRRTWSMRCSSTRPPSCSPHPPPIAPSPRSPARLRGSTLRKCVSAGEALPAATRALWKEATGIEMIDGIGATELMHIFISADEKGCLARRHRQGGAGLRRLHHGR
jgi:2-aminobenzoate-CoA ligase